MEFLFVLVISSLSVICLADSQVDRQNDNYDSRYKPTEGSTYGTSGGYYPRNGYEQYNQNRFNADLSGKEFRPPNVFATGFIPTPTPFMSPLMAQPRQYQMSLAGGPSGLIPYQVNSPFLQSSGYPMAGNIGQQYSGYGGYPNRLGIGDTMASASQGYGYGNFMSDPYYGISNRYPMAASPYNGYSNYGSLGYLGQSPSYANPASAYLNRGYASYGFGQQFAGHPYQSSPVGAYNGLNNYNNYNNGLNSGGLTQGGIGEGMRDEKSYTSSASTQTETHSDAQSSNENPIFDSHRMAKRVGRENRRAFSDHSMIE